MKADESVLKTGRTTENNGNSFMKDQNYVVVVPQRSSLEIGPQTSMLRSPKFSVNNNSP